MGKFLDELLNSGPRAWKQNTWGWKRNGEVAVSPVEDSTFLANGGIISPTPANTSNPDRIVIDPQQGRKQITVYINPGHAYDSGKYVGNTGAEGTLGYKHKVKGTDGNPVLNDDQSFKIIDSSISSLPTYVTDDLSNSPWQWIVQRNTDHSRTERDLVFTVGKKLYDLLIKMGYNAKIARTTTDHGSSLETRVDQANDFDGAPAHYLISIHADGIDDYRRDEAFAIYQERANDSSYNQRNITFSSDVMAYYTHAGKNKGAQPPDKGTSYLELSPAKAKSIRKTIIELGVTSNNTWYDETVTPPTPKEIAIELAKGLEKNVTSYYFTYNGLSGYRLNGKFYKNIDDLPEQFDVTKLEVVWNLKQSLPINEIDVDSFAKGL